MIEMNLAIALKATHAAQEKARSLGLAMTVSVVDESGRLVVTMRADGTGFMTPESSRAKAVAAAAFRTSTLKLAASHATNPFWSGVPTITRGEALPTGGAVPIIIGGRVIGGIGCGGGTAEQDDICATAGAQAVA
ncbi:MAG: heme-binding protein [Betaproteobacteria bacterium]|nr:heme-binding protein [Betaproteobacteria bacterium]